MLVTSKFSFFQNAFFAFWYLFSNLQIHSNAICDSFSLDHSEFWFSGKGLNECELKSRYQRRKITFRESEKLPVKPISPLPILYSFR